MKDKRDFFEKNLRLLSAKDPELCARLSAALTAPALTAPARYTFLESRTGRVVPALIDRDGNARALHSTVDPEKEAQRLAASLNEGGNEPCFAVFLGLGAAYAAEAALSAGTASRVLVIDFDAGGIAGLLNSREYPVLGDPRFTLLVDPDAGVIQNVILDLYNPALCGGITTLPLRARTEQDKEKFAMAGEAVRLAVEKVSADYSVQAHFGMRWFSNIIRNITKEYITTEAQEEHGVLIRKPAFPPCNSVSSVVNFSSLNISTRSVAICAAGPSLDAQIPLIKEKRETMFVIAADTALPALLSGGVKPDAVVSIDCQHISYYHFIGTACADIPLFLDIASPPLLSGFSSRLFFFAGGHPLAAYLCRKWKPLPALDTSGGNVTYACLSLAEKLGAKRVTVYGADFSYPLGRPYARGTYFYPLFERRQDRLSPLESGVSSFLYRSPFLPPESEGNRSGVTPCYETGSLRFYRKCFETKASAMEAEVTAEAGMGIPLTINRKKGGPSKDGQPAGFAPGKAFTDAKGFLNQYIKDIYALPVFKHGMDLNADERRVFTTLLPLVAAIKKRRPELAARELVEAAKAHCAEEIEKIYNFYREPHEQKR